MALDRLELFLYLATAAVYITLGVFFPRVLLSWVEGAGFLLLGVWLMPAALVYVWRRVR